MHCRWCPMRQPLASRNGLGRGHPMSARGTLNRTISDRPYALLGHAALPKTNADLVSNSLSIAIADSNGLSDQDPCSGASACRAEPGH